MSRRTRQVIIAVAVTLAFGGLIAFSCADEASAPSPTSSITTDASHAAPATRASVGLPPPSLDGPVSLEKAVHQRRSVREYTHAPVTLADVSQLLWAAQGITSSQGGRAAPSAGGTYPLEIYVAAGKVTGLEAGVYHYLPQQHALAPVKSGDLRRDLQEASHDQTWVGAAPVVFVIGAVYERTTKRYGDRGVRYVHLEAGHAAQNLCLQATALGLGAVTVGAFTDERIQELLDLPTQVKPLYVIPLGHPKSDS